MTTNEDRKKELYIRLEQLDSLLGQDIEARIAAGTQIVDAAQLQYFADRREERDFVLKELEELNSAS